MENRGAAGLRRSAIAERIKLREEWSALKGISEEPASNSQKNVPTRRQNIINKRKDIPKKTPIVRSKIIADKENLQISSADASNVLRGVVVLVDVGSDSRGLALRAALSALGATVMLEWSPLVTHLVWSQGGCKDTRARARALACRVVSPLWVEACAASTRMLPEGVFPAPPRPSDLPSPRTLKILLKKAEQENLSLTNLLCDSQRSDRPARWRISSETELDTTDTSQNTSHDTSRDKSSDGSRLYPDEAVRVNTAPRRALPVSTSPEPPHKSRRQLFTQREPAGTQDHDSEADCTPAPKKTLPKMTQRERRELAQAERMARRLLTPRPKQAKHIDKAPTMVLTGMGRRERQMIAKAVKQLNGHLQSRVNKRTDYVILGSCTTECPKNLSELFNNKLNLDKAKENKEKNMNISGVCELKTNNRSISTHTKDSNDTQNQVASTILTELDQDDVVIQVECENEDMGSILTHIKDRTVLNCEVSVDKPRTVNTLLGAVRGCRVVHSGWVVGSMKQGRWIHHIGYEVKHLMKISQRARIERSALGLMKSEYAYNVFRGMCVRVTADADQREAVEQLLSMCGAVVKQDGGNTQNGGRSVGADMTIGIREGQVCSKWVFDSVAAARMRTARRYVNK